jgi:ApaG protein
LDFRFLIEGVCTARGRDAPFPRRRNRNPIDENQKRRMSSTAFAELAGLHATVDQVIYMPQLEAPEDRPYPFVYFITIHNGSSEPITIKARKWVLTDEDEQLTVLECDGVNGKFPRLAPGQDFSFNHYHVIGSDSRAEGAFFGVTASGEAIFTRIPPFFMRVPRA